MATAAETALGILQRNGIQVSFSRRAVGAYDPATQKAGDSFTDVTVWASPAFPRTVERQKAIAPNAMGNTHTVLRAFVEAAAEPTVGSKITIDSVTYTVEGLIPYSDKNGVAAWEIFFNGN